MEEKISRMQYPYQLGSTTYDGELHQIKPTRFRGFCINGIDYYVMDYDDLTLNVRGMITILTRIGNRFYKVPLTSVGYLELQDFLSVADWVFEYPLDSCYIGDVIGLAETMNFRYERKNQEPIMEYAFFIPLDRNGYYDFRAIFQDGGKDDLGDITKYNYQFYENTNMMEYNFNKKPISNLFVNAIYSGSQNYSIGPSRNDQYKDDGVKYYTSDVEIPEGAFIDTPVVTPYSVRTQRALFVPGIHRVTCYYSDFVDKEDFNNAINCNSLSIQGDGNTYTWKGAPMVFKDGGSKILNMYFSNNNNRRYRL